MSHRSIFRPRRVLLVVIILLALEWWFGMRMPGKNVSGAAKLTPGEIARREELRSDVQTLAGDIGERNLSLVVSGMQKVVAALAGAPD
jgi:hypothetical protein